MFSLTLIFIQLIYLFISCFPSKIKLIKCTLKICLLTWVFSHLVLSTADSSASGRIYALPLSACIHLPSLQVFSFSAPSLSSFSLSSTTTAHCTPQLASLLHRYISSLINKQTFYSGLLIHTKSSFIHSSFTRQQQKLFCSRF